jgi:large subunit ribosomal protein L15
MKLTEILSKAGKKTSRKRVGRGQGSGTGKTSGRGHKGAGQRSGFKKNRPAFEGGQMPLVRRLPKRGFTNAPFRRRFDVVNVKLLEKWFEAGDSVDLAVLQSRGLIKPRHGRLKILGAGELSKKLTVVADAISDTARRKIEEAGGSAESSGSTGKK